MATQTQRAEINTQAPVESNKDSGEQLSRDINLSAPSNGGAAKLENSAKQTQQLVKDNVLPEMGIDFGPSEKVGQSPIKSANSSDKSAHSFDKSAHSFDLNSPLLKGVANPDGLQKDVADTVNKIAGAKDDPTKAGKIFEDAADKFSKENPANNGQIFGAMMKDELKANPETQNFGVNFDSSAGNRDGKTETRLTRKDGDQTNVIGDATHVFSNGATKEELPGIADQVKADIPQVLSDLDNPQSLQKLVEASNEMIKSSGLGNDQDVKNTFEKAAAEFKRDNPNASATTLGTVLNNALRHNPQTTDLQVNIADGGGQLPGTGDVTLIDRSKDKKERVMSSVEVSHN